MAKKGKHISKSMLQGIGNNSPVAGNATSTGCPLDNKGLQTKYDEMHKQGAGAWFSDGREERETILKMGEPWHAKHVIEIGCGIGELCNMIRMAGAFPVLGIDYSEEAINKAESLPKADDGVSFCVSNYRDGVFCEIDNLEGTMNWDTLVMQGVLEHLDDPFGELQWMIEHFKPKTVITSSPCFLNPRGIVWMTLDMMGAVMSKTDLHFLHTDQFEDFCQKKGYKLAMKDCDWGWGNAREMIDDLEKRIPLAIQDGNLPFNPLKIMNFMEWLKELPVFYSYGATMVYRIDI